MSVIFTALGTVCALLLIPSILRACRNILQTARIIWLTWRVPGPPCIPLLGCLPTFLTLWTDMHGTLLRLVERYGTIVRIQVLHRTTLVVMDPDDVQVVCTHPALSYKPALYKLMNPHLGLGLVTMNGPAYKRHRKTITPSLHLDILQDFVPIFAKNAEAMVRRLEDLADSGSTFDVAPECGMLANMSVMETVMSSRTNCDSPDEFAATAHLMEAASRVSMGRVMKPWWTNDLLFMLSPHYTEYKRTAADMNILVTRVLDSKTKDHAEGVSAPPRRRMTFLDHVLRSEECANMSKEELRDEVKTFLFAGSATSMDFLSLAVVMFSIYPEIQKKVQQEVDEVLGAFGPDSSSRSVEPEDLGHMQYTERVLRELLRYAPTAAMFFRTALEDVMLPSGTLVPKGCIVALVPAGTHRIEKHFADPLRFDPDRFLPEQCRGRHPFAYIPFSAGTRNCVGQRYAVMFAKTAVATLLRHCSFLPVPGGPKDLSEVNVTPGVTISVRGGALVRVRRRVRSNA